MNLNKYLQEWEMHVLQPRQSRPMGVLWEKQWALRGITRKASIGPKVTPASVCGNGRRLVQILDINTDICLLMMNWTWIHERQSLTGYNWVICKENSTRWMGMHELKRRRVEEIEKRPCLKLKWWQRCPGFISKKTIRSHQRETDCPGRNGKKQSREGRRWGLQRRPMFWSLFWQFTVMWPHLTLSMSSDNSVLSWPRLPLMALASLRLYFFCSSSQRSSEHFRLRCWPPPSQPTSTQQPVFSPPGTTEAFPSPFTNSFLVLDWMAGRPPFCVPFWVHS